MSLDVEVGSIGTVLHDTVSRVYTTRTIYPNGNADGKGEQIGCLHGTRVAEKG